MSENDSTPRGLGDLRQRAEAMSSKRNASNSLPDLDAMSPEETRRALHELCVYQIELEMQNEELRQAHVELAASRARYFDLYDMAPVGYCTVSVKGMILEANLTAASMLGVARADLVRQRFSGFIQLQDENKYYLLRKNLLASGEPQECEVRMRKKDKPVVWVRLVTTLAEEHGCATAAGGVG